MSISNDINLLGETGESLIRLAITEHCCRYMPVESVLDLQDALIGLTAKIARTHNDLGRQEANTKLNALKNALNDILEK